MIDKKYFIKSTISFILIVVLFCTFLPVSYLLRPMYYNRNNVSGLYYEKENSLDMIYIGGSACFTFWEPLRAWKNSGIASFNFAHDTMTPQAIKHFIIEAQKTQKPKLWIIDLRPFQYADENYSDEILEKNMYCEIPVRKSTDSLSYSENRTQLINKSTTDFSKRLEYYFDISKNHTEWAKLAFYLFLKGGIKDGSYVLDYVDNVVKNPFKGYYFVPKTKSVEFTDYSNIAESVKIDDDANKCFIDLLDYCKEENLEVLFVVHSYIQEKEDKKEFNYMKEVIDKYGFGFINTNDYYGEMGLDYSFDFYNENHVNIFGAEKYTDFLSQYILKNYELPDRRDDVNYSSWNEDYENFNKEVENNKLIIKNLVE